MKNKELDWPEFLNILASHCRSQRGKEACLATDVLMSKVLAQTSAENILAAQFILAGGGSPDFQITDSITPIIDRLTIQATLDTKELSIMRRFLTLATTLRIGFKENKSPWSMAIFSRLADFKSQLSAINHVISSDDEINEDASATLASLCEERRRLSREITRTLDQIVASRKMENILQDKYVTNREGRMVIPVKSGNQHDVKGLIHDASQSKQTVFMEPEEAVPLNNRLREVQILIQDEIQRILAELSRYLMGFQTSFINADSALLECAVIFAKADLNQRLHGSTARFSENGAFNLIDLRHPLLVYQGIDVVPNSITLNEENHILLLSGPNAGGKTVLLKAIGLAAQMARCGLPIPTAPDSQLPFLKSLDAIVGDLQSVGANLSSFSSHMARLTDALKQKGSDCLILVDEICGATDPEEGAALARSFIEHFGKQNVFAVITSHLGPLKEKWESSSGVRHGSLEFDTKTGKPTFQLLVGFPGRSLALVLAESMGVPAFILDRAKSFLSPQSQMRSQELKEIEDFKSQLMELKSLAQHDRSEAAKAKEQYSGLVTKFREQRDRWMQKAIEKTEKKIETLIEEARQQRLRDRTLQDIKADLPEIIKAKPSAFKVQTLDEFKNTFKPGTPAYSSRLSRQVIIQSDPDSKGQVMVLADSIRIQVPWHGLSSVVPPKEEPERVIRRAALQNASVNSSVDEEPSALDLRGQRVDEAIGHLEKWLDQCMRQQRDRVKVIHGFGTEQLKKSVRQYLSKSDYVSK